MPEPAMPAIGFGMKVACRPCCWAIAFRVNLKVDALVGAGQRVAVLEVDLVLADGDLVVAGLDLDAHLLQGADHVLADGGGQVSREIEITGTVVGQDADLAVVSSLEEEELQLRSGIERVAKLGAARSSWRRSTARGSPGKSSPSGRYTQQITRAVVLGASLPGDDVEGGEIRHQVHVALGDARKAGDRRAVEPLPVLDDIREDFNRDRDHLDDAHDVGELEVDKSNGLLATDFQYCFRAWRRCFASDWRDCRYH